MQQNDAGPSRLVVSGFQYVHHQTVAVVDESGANPARERLLSVQDRFVPHIGGLKAIRSWPEARTPPELGCEGRAGQQRTGCAQEASPSQREAIARATTQVPT